MATAEKASFTEVGANTQDSRQQPAPEPSGGHPAAPAEAAPPAQDAALDPAATLGHGSVQHAIEEATAKMLDAFSRQFAANDRRNTQIDTLHAELTKHRDDLLGRALEPIVKSFIQLYDEMGRAVDRLARKPEAAVSKEEAAALLKGFQNEIALALARNDVDAYSEKNEGRDFDGRRQAVIDHKDAATDDQAGKVAVCLRPGFESRGIVIQKERVVVYRKPAAAKREA